MDAADARAPAGKRRRTYRRRDDDAASSPARLDDDDAASPAAAAAAAVLRPRRGARFRGLAFAARPRPDAVAAGARAPDADDEPAQGGIADRFMHQTGLVADPDDRHMTDYIESRLSSRAVRSSALPGPLAPSPPPAAPAPDSDADADAARAPARSADQPTKHGKLFEVDIPADVRSRRDDAKRRLAEQAPKPRPARHRRGSDDMKRDEFVEQFLHENRLDVYDLPQPSAAAGLPSSSAAAADDDDQRTADDRMAEQFRRQYLDDLAQRRQRRRHAHPPRQQPPPGDVLRGPKLGGSRNSRAAVRNLLLQQEKEKVGRKV